MNLYKVTILIPNNSLLNLSGDQLLSLLIVAHPYKPSDLVESSQALQRMAVIVVEDAVQINVCLQGILGNLLERRCYEVREIVVDLHLHFNWKNRIDM